MNFLDKTGLERLWNKIKSLIPTRTSQLSNDSGYITGYSETYPTVPSWAKQATKPTYTYSEIEGKPATYTPSVHTHISKDITDLSIPTKTSDLEKDDVYTKTEINTMIGDVESTLQSINEGAGV